MFACIPSPSKAFSLSFFIMPESLLFRVVGFFHQHSPNHFTLLASVLPLRPSFLYSSSSSSSSLLSSHQLLVPPAGLGRIPGCPGFCSTSSSALAWHHRPSMVCVFVCAREENVCSAFECTQGLVLFFSLKNCNYATR